MFVFILFHTPKQSAYEGQPRHTLVGIFTTYEKANQHIAVDMSDHRNTWLSEYDIEEWEIN